jgi:hypothetical protein
MELNVKMCDDFSSVTAATGIGHVMVIKWRRMSWAGHVAHVWEKRNAYRVMMCRSEGKKLLGRTRFGWEDNIKTYLKELG